MKKSNDENEEALQQWLERGVADTVSNMPHYDKKDLTAYRMLFEALEEKPVVTLPPDFSDSIVANLQARQDRILDFRWNFLLPLMVGLLLGITYSVLLYSNAEYAHKLLSL